MNSTIVNFMNAKVALKEKDFLEKQSLTRQKTHKFAFEVNSLVANYDIDPIHQATLLMAKAIDVLATAGPVPSKTDEQHARAKNLLQSVITARTNLKTANVRIISNKTFNTKTVNDEFAF